VYWPALLLGAGLEVPSRLFAHGWWTRDGAKISKSVGNVIDPKELVETFGVDQVRYFLMSEVPFGSDGDYSETQMLACANGFLANALGNLQMRVMSLMYKNCEAAVPAPEAPLTDDDRELLSEARKLAGRVRAHLAKQELHKACGAIDALVRAGNRYIDEQAPWALKKTDTERMTTVLYVLADTLRHVAVCASPVMPGACSRMLDQLCVPADRRSTKHLTPEETTEDGDLFKSSVAPGTPLQKPVGLFPRIEIEERPAA